MKHELLFKRHGLFDARVPRYTSYPPANRFEPVETSELAGRWVASLSGDAEISVYLHIPFCKRLCWFCACRTQGTKTNAPVQNYVDHLVREIGLYARRIPAGVRMARLHIGGGTPTLLTVEMIDQIMAALDAALERTEAFEFSVEIDPTECTLEGLAAFRRHGMNRASIGVQDFDQKVQDAIGRQQGFDQTKVCVTQLRDLGVTNINLDILYGLPFQTAQSLQATLDKVLELDPDRLAAFGYAHVPWMSRRQVMIQASALPDPYERLNLFQEMSDRLLRSGYIQIGIDHFVKPMDGLAKALAEHRLHRNFQGYTDDNCEVLLGMGASAISRYPQGYLQNAASTSNYLAEIASGNLATRKGIELSDADHVTADLIESLMCYGRIDLARLPRYAAYDLDALRVNLDLLSGLFPDVVRKVGDAIQIDREHYPLLRIMAARLDGFDVNGGSHSVAV